MLLGGALPFHGAEFPVEQRVVTKWLPGNGTEATQHVLGPREGAPEWEGEWNTTKMVSSPSLYSERGSGPPRRVARAQTLCLIVEAILRAGALLKVTWTEDDQDPVVRVGRLVKLTPSYRSLDDVHWHMAWEWKGRGGVGSRVATTKKDAQLSAHKKVEAELSNVTAEVSAAAIVSAFTDLPGSASSFSLGSLEGFVDSIKAFTQSFANQVNALGARIKKVGELIRDVETLPADVAAQFVDAMANVIADCEGFSDDVSRRGPEAYSQFDQSASVKSIVAASSYFGGAKAAADACALAAAEARGILIRKSGRPPGAAGGAGKPQPDVGEVLVARVGDTFQSIARRRLGSADLGPAVARASGYPAFALAPNVGDVVVVPTLASAQGLMP